MQIPNPISRMGGFSFTVNEAVADLVIQMEHYHRNWEEFAEAGKAIWSTWRNPGWRSDLHIVCRLLDDT